MRRLRQLLLIMMFGPVIAFVTVFSWFTVWPFIALMEWLHDGEVHWSGIARDSWGLADEFVHSVENAR